NPLTRKLSDDGTKTRHVAAGSGEVGDDSGVHRFTDCRHHNWDCVCCSLSCERSWRSPRHDEVHFEANEFCRKRWEARSLTLGGPVIQPYILSFGITKFLKSPPQGSKVGNV